MSVRYITKEDVESFVVGKKVGVSIQYFSRRDYYVYEVVKLLPTQIVLNRDTRFKRDTLKRIGEADFYYSRMVVIDEEFIALWQRQNALRTIDGFKFESLETETLAAISKLIVADPNYTTKRSVIR